MRSNIRPWINDLDIGTAMWSRPDSRYLIPPEKFGLIAELPNIEAIEYSAPSEMYVRLTQMVGSAVRPPMLESTDAEKADIGAAYEACSLERQSQTLQI